MSLLKFNYLNGFESEEIELPSVEVSEQQKLEEKLSHFENNQQDVKS